MNDTVELKQLYRFHWRDGSTTEIVSTDVVDACVALGHREEDLMWLERWETLPLPAGAAEQ